MLTKIGFLEVMLLLLCKYQLYAQLHMPCQGFCCLFKIFNNLMTVAPISQIYFPIIHYYSLIDCFFFFYSFFLFKLCQNDRMWLSFACCMLYYYVHEYHIKNCMTCMCQTEKILSPTNVGGYGKLQRVQILIDGFQALVMFVKFIHWTTKVQF